MYIIVGLGITAGNLAPVLFGYSAFSIWGVLGILVGGLFGVWVFWKLRQAGYLE